MVRLVRGVDDSQVDDLRVLSCTSKEFTQAWMLDTGTYVHVCTSATSFHGEMEEDRDYFHDWKGRSNKLDGIGLVRVRTANGFDSEGDNVILELEETRFSPNGPCNLISQERLEMDGWVPETPFASSPSERITYFTNDEYPGVQLVFKKKRGHYWLDASPVAANAQVCTVTPTPKNNKLLTWHMRFAHQNVEAMKLMIKKKMILGVDSLTMEDFKEPFRCIACQRAKQKRMSFRRKRAKRQKVCYARMMSDISPVGVLTPGGNLYFQDEASRFKWCYLLKEKSDANQNIIDLVLQIEKEHAIKIFSCDRGGEFVNTELKVFLKRHGIRLLTTNSYTPEENCLVEKMNGCLMNKVRAINEAAGLPMCLWGEVLGYVVDVDNMSSTKALNGMTPYEKLHGTKPQVRDLHVCGSVVFQHVPKKKRQGKLDRRADPGIFLGYAKM
ncbi:hypothetical protein PF008_g24214 [Phytophthora fragariae]|uniref:Integrase catalytic domain-containing protein n=1 Tax=Phytophthora fragariae TaxID=53985 RepID=A0A6G0QPD3_9STRA|nr:hypothetical protein PF008_g24214 [Phytophthora fragariae]